MFARLPLFAAVAATVVAATGAASAHDRTRLMLAEPLTPQVMIAEPRPMIIVRPRLKRIGCPEGWLPATPPLNWQLGCLPNTLTLGD